jgi:hypothetical protein
VDEYRENLYEMIAQKRMSVRRIQHGRPAAKRRAAGLDPQNTG